MNRGYTVDRRVGQAQCTRRIFRVTEPDNYGTKSGFKRCNGVGRGGREELEDQLQWVLNDDGQVHLLGAELALLPNQNSTLPIERSEETALNQLNAVGKMSHVHVTEGWGIITWALRPVTVVMTLITAAALKSKQPNMDFPA